jgi:hypothetical protein
MSDIDQRLEERAAFFRAVPVSRRYPMRFVRPEPPKSSLVLARPRSLILGPDGKPIA